MQILGFFGGVVIEEYLLVILAYEYYPHVIMVI